VIQETARNIIDAEKNIRQQQKRRLFLSRIKFGKMKGKFLSPRGIAQFPVTSAFSMTLSTSKGRTFDHNDIYLLEIVHGYDQIYTELTKGRKYQNLKFTLHISNIEDTFSHVRTFTKSIIKELSKYYSGFNFASHELCLSFLCQKEGFQVCSKHNQKNCCNDLINQKEK